MCLKYILFQVYIVLGNGQQREPSIYLRSQDFKYLFRYILIILPILGIRIKTRYTP